MSTNRKHIIPSSHSYSSLRLSVPNQSLLLFLFVPRCFICSLQSVGHHIFINFVSFITQHLILTHRSVTLPTPCVCARGATYHITSPPRFAHLRLHRIAPRTVSVRPRLPHRDMAWPCSRSRSRSCCRAPPVRARPCVRAELARCAGHRPALNHSD